MQCRYILLNLIYWSSPVLSNPLMDMQPKFAKKNPKPQLKPCRRALCIKQLHWDSECQNHPNPVSMRVCKCWDFNAAITWRSQPCRSTVPVTDRHALAAGRRALVLLTESFAAIHPRHGQSGLPRGDPRRVTLLCHSETETDLKHTSGFVKRAISMPTPTFCRFATNACASPTSKGLVNSVIGVGTRAVLPVPPWHWDLQRHHRWCELLGIAP